MKRAYKTITDQEREDTLIRCYNAGRDAGILIGLLAAIIVMLSVSFLLILTGVHR